MMTLVDAPAVATLLAWSLVNFLWQGLAIGVVAYLALRRLRNTKPLARHAVALAGFILLISTPILSSVYLFTRQNTGASGTQRVRYIESTAKSVDASSKAAESSANLPAVSPNDAATPSMWQRLASRWIAVATPLLPLAVVL